SAMIGSATKSVSGLVMPPPTHRFCLSDGTLANSSFQYLRQILETSKENEADVRLFIQPAHVYLLEVLRILGVSEDYKNWRKELISLVEHVNSVYPESNAFPLWDFGGYNSVTMTEVPPMEEPNRSVLWYWDIAHYKKTLGDLIQDRIFGFNPAGRMVPEDFGIKISSKNIEQYHTAQEIKQREYAVSHVGDIRELTKRVSDIKKNIRTSECN
ncbi:uncharacterized protein METZ01_LOCUS361290, partial [marine metagenome]